jgi:hypothetical protein
MDVGMNNRANVAASSMKNSLPVGWTHTLGRAFPCASRLSLATGLLGFLHKARTLSAYQEPMMAKRRLELEEGSQKEYAGPEGGYGSLKSVSEILLPERVPAKAARPLSSQNKPQDMCVSCAWAKPAKPHPAEFCGNGAKATAWEITAKRTDQAFFQRHTLAELETWRDHDHDLEVAGRLTHPMRWDPASDRYMPFGGYKQSRNGREWGEFGLNELLEIKGIPGYSG